MPKSKQTHPTSNPNWKRAMRRVLLLAKLGALAPREKTRLLEQIDKRYHVA